MVEVKQATVLVDVVGQNNPEFHFYRSFRYFEKTVSTSVIKKGSKKVAESNKLLGPQIRSLQKL